MKLTRLPGVKEKICIRWQLLQESQLLVERLAFILLPHEIKANQKLREGFPEIEECGSLNLTESLCVFMLTAIYGIP